MIKGVEKERISIAEKKYIKIFTFPKFEIKKLEINIVANIFNANKKKSKFCFLFIFVKNLTCDVPIRTASNVNSSFQFSFTFSNASSKLKFSSLCKSEI